MRGNGGVPQEVAEAALAHTPAPILRAYKRTDYLERRKPLMQFWADYLDGSLDDTWKWHEGDEALLNALRESRRLLTEAKAQIAELRTALELLNRAA